MQNVRMLQGVIPPNIRQLYYKEVKKEIQAKKNEGSTTELNTLFCLVTFKFGDHDQIYT